MKFRKGSLKNFFFISLCKIYLGRYKCDVYHFGYSGIAAFYLPVIQALNRRIIISCRGTAENVKPLSETGRISKLRTLFEEADKIHCVSASMVNTIQQYNAPFSKIFINRPAVDIKFFSRKSDYLPSKKIRILSVGRLVFQKGFMIGLLAMVELNKMFCNFEWIIMGDGPEDEELFFNIHLMGLEDKIKLAGKKTKDEVLEGYESTDIFFLPSVSEGIANVVIEAMAMELPVVSSSCGGLKELITGDTNGLLCNNYDYKAMAKALYDLSTNFEKRKTLGKAARKTVEEDFSLERYIDVFEQHYYELLN
jgi:colanic acid/amylovoran biosynthesis glycosyltransferase